MMRNEVTGRSKPMYPWDKTIERTVMAGRGKFPMVIANSPFQTPKVMLGLLGRRSCDGRHLVARYSGVVEAKTVIARGPKNATLRDYSPATKRDGLPSISPSCQYYLGGLSARGEGESAGYICCGGA